MGEIYHVYNRGVEKRDIFKDDGDRFRFIHDLFEFNDREPALHTGRPLKKQFLPTAFQTTDRKPRKLIVHILAFCLMPNHFHLLLEQKTEGGISLFMQKLCTGYTMYFNKRYERSGHLFQGKYKYVMVAHNAHLIHLPYYIHFNPLDMKFKEWRTRELHKPKAALEFLESYRWSSHLDYLGKKNFPSVTQREFLAEMLGEPREYRKNLMQQLKNFSLPEIEQLVIERYGS